jgi:hypothetical protein
MTEAVLAASHLCIMHSEQALHQEEYMKNMIVSGVNVENLFHWHTSERDLA